MKELEKTLIKVNNHLENIAIMLYQEKEQEGYKEYAQYIGELTTLVSEIFKYKNINTVLPFDENRFLENLTLSVKALEDRDTVMVADILYHELSGQLNDLITHLESQIESSLGGTL